MADKINQAHKDLAKAVDTYIRTMAEALKEKLDAGVAKAQAIKEAVVKEFQK